MKDAEGILTPDQFAKFKAECNKHKTKGRGLNSLFANGGRRRYYLQEIMIALASAGAHFVREIYAT